MRIDAGGGWRDYTAERESLQSMAYYVMTVLERPVGGRKPASKAFANDEGVLRKIGELASTRGGAATARKGPETGTYQELSESEHKWLEAATKRVIIRLGERASGTPLAQLTRPICLGCCDAVVASGGTGRWAA